MTPERYQQVEQIYQQALGRPVGERAAFLETACAGDESLRREVESLLAAYEQAKSFLERPPEEVAAEMLAAEQARSMAGRRLAHYQIRSLLGTGGMGEVYLAEDTKLSRKIAIKVLPERLSSDKERLRRFEQEARLASSLNHPNIITIYDIGETGSTPYIAMELIDGRTLREILASDSLSLRKMIDIAKQVADGLAKAHEAGIVHRDLKPENLMITKDGFVKILDFGLSKLVAPIAEHNSEIATMKFGQTQPGKVLGTVGYMSPEQASGQPVDFRSDQFSFGAVLYEMATGKPAFKRGTTVQTLSAIIEDEPESIALLNPKIPAHFRWIVERCLAKDPKDRYASTRDLARDLDSLHYHLLETRGEVLTTPVSRVRVRYVWMAALVLVIIAVVGIGLYWLIVRSKAIDSLAVLPFVNLSADPNTEYLSDGITESLINNLSQLPNLKVMSRNSIFHYKGREIDAQIVGRDLGVRAVLLGRVLQRGNDLSISAELVDASDKSHIWGEQYNRKLADILAVQEEIAREISEKLRLRLSGEQKQRLTKRYTENTEAYQLYLKGRYYWNKRTPEGTKIAIEYFQQAIEKDPNYALAYAGLADCYVVPVNPLPPKEKMPKAKAAAVKALELDDTLAEAHTSLARVLTVYEWNWTGAEKGFKRAIELNPRYEVAHQWYGGYFETMARHNESIAERRRAQELDPLSLIINFEVGVAFYYARDYDQAIEQFQKTLELDPKFPPVHAYLPAAYEQKGMYDEAIARVQKAISLKGGTDWVLSMSGHGHVYAVSGRKSEAQRVLNELIQLSKQRYVPATEIALIYAGLGEKDQAFEWLEKAYEERSFQITWLKVEPRWDSLRSDPRFADLLRRVGLP